MLLIPCAFQALFGVHDHVRLKVCGAASTAPSSVKLSTSGAAHAVGVNAPVRIIGGRWDGACFSLKEIDGDCRGGWAGWAEFEHPVTSEIAVYRRAGRALFQAVAGRGHAPEGHPTVRVPAPTWADHLARLDGLPEADDPCWDPGPLAPPAPAHPARPAEPEWWDGESDEDFWDDRPF